MDLTKLTDEELSVYSDEIARRNRLKTDAWAEESARKQREWEKSVQDRLVKEVRAVLPDIIDEQIENLKDPFEDYLDRIYS